MVLAFASLAFCPRRCGSGWHLSLDDVARSLTSASGERRGSFDLDQCGHLWLDHIIKWAIQQGILHAPQYR